ncbi:MAG: UDP-3-O-(3-hydroxymyristoyl)glucosamine N-acyltransferase [Desulfobacterales bacterium]
MKKTLIELADLVGGQVKGTPQKLILEAAPFEDAGPDAITLARSANYLNQIASSAAGAFIVPDGFEKEGHNLLQSSNPYADFARIMTLYHPAEQLPIGIHPSVILGAGTQCGRDAAIGPMTVIGNHVRIGQRANIYPGVVIGDHVSIGDDVRLYPQVTVLARCRLGDRVTIHAGSVIGSDGFGFAPDGERYQKIPHTGVVQIDDDVEIGANNSIDRGTFGKTHLKEGVKTDNLVHIAHNVTVGENTVLVAQVGISGSSSLGRHVVLAGQVGVAGHLDIGDHVMVGGQSGIASDVPSGQMISGSPTMPHKTWLRVQRIIPRLPELRKKIVALEKGLQRLQKER